jgi:hypothetical protein
MIEETKREVAEYFDTDDAGLLSAACRLQHDGYHMTDILTILKAAFRAGYREGENEAQY